MYIVCKLLFDLNRKIWYNVFIIILSIRESKNDRKEK